nr:flagellar basal-body MS-ring/collar protein FliF [Azospirillum sp. SYSU D00513]
MLISKINPKLAAFGLIALAVLGAFGWLILRGASTADQRALVAGASPADIGQYIQALDAVSPRIPYVVTGDGTTILVPNELVGQARIALAQGGVTASGPLGYELLDNASGIAMTTDQWNLARQRALEGELARAIMQMRGIRAAKVSLVMPVREAFSRDVVRPRASVMLTLASSDVVGRAEVAAIRSLVASSVARMQIQDVAVVDNFLRDLAPNEAAGGSGPGGRTDERRYAIEDRIRRAIEEQLAPVVGLGRARAVVQAELSTAKEFVREQSFDPKTQIPRSTWTTNTRENSNETNPSVSADTNLPDANTQPQPGVQTNKEESQETINYELGSVVRERTDEGGGIKRLSISILLDGVCSSGPDGKPECRDRSPEELARIGNIAKAAANYVEDRGDTFAIESMAFAAVEPIITEGPQPAPAGLMERLAENLLAVIVGSTILGAVLIALVFLLVGRRRRIAEQAATELAQQQMALPAPGEAGTAGAAGLLMNSSSTALQTGQANPDTDDEAMVDLGRAVEGLVRESYVTKVRELIRSNPDDAAIILRALLATDPRKRTL